MKIKRKVEMNEKELIKHLVNHESTTIYFSGISYDGAWLSIEPEIESKVHFELKDVSENGKAFTVEVEEEITEDTELDLIERFIGGMGYACYTSHTMSINKCLRMAPEHITITHYYIENDDREPILIWRDGKLVE